MRREALLKSAFAEVYPALIPGRWYTAGAVSGLVKGSRIVREGPATEFPDRVLDPAHFEFRGGQRRGRWSGLRTRRVDRRPGRTSGQSAPGGMITV